MITDHTGSPGISNGLNTKFIYEMAPNVPIRVYELPTYQEWGQRLGTMPRLQLPMGCLILFRKI